MNKTISTKMTKANIDAVIVILQEMPGQLEALARRLSDEELHIPLGPNQRSLTQDLGHLINNEARTAESIHLALLLDEPLAHDIHPERQWGKLPLTDALAFADLLAYFSIRRKMLLCLLISISDTQWQRVIHQPHKTRKESVYWLARALALHEKEHLTDLTNKLSNTKARLLSTPDIL